MKSKSQSKIVHAVSLALASLLLGAVGSVARAQSPLDLLPEGQNPPPPPEAQQRLDHLVGRWHVRAERLDAEGKVARVVEWENEAHYLIEGRVVLLTHNAQALGVLSKTLVFYSHEDATFYLVDVNQKGELWILSGGLDDFVITSRPKKTPDGREFLIRFHHVNRKPDSEEAIQEISFDDGETWRKSVHQYLTRIDTQ